MQDHPDTRTPLIHFDSVVIQFNGGSVIDEISFKVYQGDKFLIYGRSGIGKTTFFRLLLGFEKIQQGHIFFNGAPVNEQSVWAIRKQIAYVSQDLDIGTGPVLGMIKAFFSYKQTKAFADNEHQLAEFLEFLNLPKKILQEDYQQLSGGEKQRIAIIIALLLKRNIFLFDEVTSSLDRELKIKIIRFFLDHPEWTLVSISHDHDWLNSKGLRILKVGS